MFPVTSWVRRRKRRRLRAAMRGYERLRGDLVRITRLKEALTVTRLSSTDARVSRLFFGAALRDAEVAIRQYSVSRFLGMEFNEAIVRTAVRPGRALDCPVPREWYGVLRAHGFAVAPARARTLWLAQTLRLFAGGMVYIARQVLASVRAIGHPAPALGRFVQFHALAPGNLPQPGSDGRSHDIISWYLRWPGKSKIVTAVAHDVRAAAQRDGNVRIIPGRPSVPPLSEAHALLRFIGWSLAAITLAAVDLFRGRWWTPMMLRDAAAAALVRFQRSDGLADEYLFHNSDWAYRPLWTYEAERRQARISFYFYSTNTEGFRRRGEYAPLIYGWAAMNWPRYMVWDEYQAEFVRRAAGAHAEVDVVGPIWFNTSAELPPEPTRPSIAVFDVMPFRASFRARLGVDYCYYEPDVSEAFLRDIQGAADRAGMLMLWKHKRHVTPTTHRRYRAIASRIDAASNVVKVNPDVSAVRLIEQADIVISMPFTSTALIARFHGKRSCYYDPIAFVDKEDRGAHGIPVVSGPRELREWIAANAPRQERMPMLATLR